MSPLLPSTIRRLMRIPQVPTIWEFTRRQAPANLRFQGANGAGQDLILIGDASDHVLRAFESVDCEGGHETIVRALVKAMERPEIPLKAVRPIRIVCPDRTLQMFLRGALQGLGITFTYSPHLTVVEDFFEELQGAPPPPEHIPEIWERNLNEMATRLWQAQPWDNLPESLAVKITLDRFGVESLWACALGSRSLDPGVVFFRSEAAAEELFAASTGINVRPLEQIHHLDCLAVVFPDGFHTNQSERAAPLFASIHPYEGFRDFLDAEESMLLWCAAESYLHFLSTNAGRIESRRVDVPLLSRSILTSAEETWGSEISTVSTLDEDLTGRLEKLAMADAGAGKFAHDYQSYNCINLASRESNLLMGSLPYQFLEAVDDEGHDTEEAELTFTDQAMIPFVAIRLAKADAEKMTLGLEQDSTTLELAIIDGRNNADQHSSNLLVALTVQTPPRIIWQGPSHLPTPSSMIAWRKEVASTDGQCLLLIARGNPTRGQTTIQPSEIEGMFLTAFRTPEELGIGPMIQSELPVNHETALQPEC